MNSLPLNTENARAWHERRNMKWLIIIFMIFTSSCVAYQSQWKACEEICKPNGGALFLDVTFPHRRCDCVNGLSVMVRDIE